MASEEIKTQDIVESSPETIDQLKAEIAELRHINDALENTIKDMGKKIETMYELPVSPIECAEMLINANYKYDTPDFLKRIGGPKEQYIAVYTPKELRQIAEHLLVYCNYNEGDDED